jgi:hypothetical protein
LGCDKDTGASNTAPASAAAPNGSGEPKADSFTIGGAVAGTLALGDGAPSGANVNATIMVVGRPELTTKSDENGAFQINNVQPGTLSILALSDSGAQLRVTSTPAGFCVKFPDLIVKDKLLANAGEGSMRPSPWPLNIAAHQPPNGRPLNQTILLHLRVLIIRGPLVPSIKESTNFESSLQTWPELCRPLRRLGSSESSTVPSPTQATRVPFSTSTASVVTRQVTRIPQQPRAFWLMTRVSRLQISA